MFPEYLFETCAFVRDLGQSFKSVVKSRPPALTTPPVSNYGTRFRSFRSAFRFRSAARVLQYSPDTAHLVLQSGLYYLARTPKCIQSVIAPPAPGVFSRYRSCGSLSCRTTPPAWLHTAELYPWCMRVQVLCEGTVLVWCMRVQVLCEGTVLY